MLNVNIFQITYFKTSNWNNNDESNIEYKISF